MIVDYITKNRRTKGGYSPFILEHKNLFAKEEKKNGVKSKISIIDKWEFLDSVKLIKTKCSQKNVYRNLAKIFSDEEYMEQIQRTTPAQLKNNLLTNSPENFTENDFEGDKLMVTSKNLDTVMKMLAKGFKFNFFTNSAEEL